MWLPRWGHKRQCVSTLSTGIPAFEDSSYEVSILFALKLSCVRKIKLALMERSQGETCDFVYWGEKELSGRTQTVPTLLPLYPVKLLPICHSYSHHHVKNSESPNCPDPEKIWEVMIIAYKSVHFGGDVYLECSSCKWKLDQKNWLDSGTPFLLPPMVISVVCFITHHIRRHMKSGCFTFRDAQIEQSCADSFQITVSFNGDCCLNQVFHHYYWVVMASRPFQ